MRIEQAEDMVGPTTIAAITQWSLSFTLYFLVVATKMHVIIRMLPCHTVGPRMLMLLALPTALVSPMCGIVPMHAGTFVLWMALNVIMFAAIPFWCSSGTKRARLYMIIHFNLIFLSAYLLVLMLSHIRTMFHPASASFPLRDQASEAVLEIGFILVACHATDGFAQRIIPRAGKPSFDAFLSFSALQCMMIGAAVLVIIMRGVTDPLFLLITFALAIMCLLVDVALGTIIWKEHDMHATRHAADVQQVLLDSYLDESSSQLRQARIMAQRRHDARNQLSVVRILAAQGKTRQALAHVSELRAECAKDMCQ